MASKLENHVASFVINHMINNGLDPMSYDFGAIVSDLTQEAHFDSAGHLVIVVDTTLDDAVEKHRRN